MPMTSYMSHLLTVDEKRDLGPTPTWYIFLKKTTVYIKNGPKIHHVISSVYSQNISRVRKNFHMIQKPYISYVTFVFGS